MNAKEALAQLKVSPEAFLKKNLLICAGNGLQPSKLVNEYYIHSKDTGYLQGKKYDNAFSITTNAIPTETYPNASKECFKAHAVRMFPTKNYGGALALEFDWNSIEAYVLDGNAEVMVTGMLNGCTFVAARSGSKTIVAHIQPGKVKSLLTKSAKSLDLKRDNEMNTKYKVDIDGVQLRNLIKEKGRFNGFPNDPVKTFGRGDYPVNAYVIGVLIGGVWEIYGQQVDNNGVIASIGQIVRIL